MSEIELRGTQIMVTSHKGHRAFEIPLGVAPAEYRRILEAYDTAYRVNGTLPSVTEVMRYVNGVDTATVSGMFLKPEFQEALRFRGIEMEPDSGLSIEQATALNLILNFSDRRSLQAKLRDINVPMTRYQAWMRHPLFKEAYRKQSEDNFQDAVPMALNKLMGNVDAGDQRAIEKVLEITGRWNPAAQQVEDVKRVVTAIVESVIRNVTDKAVRQAIMDDVQAQVTSYALTEQQSITGG